MFVECFVGMGCLSIGMCVKLGFSLVGVMCGSYFECVDLFCIDFGCGFECIKDCVVGLLFCLVGLECLDFFGFSFCVISGFVFLGGSCLVHVYCEFFICFNLIGVG